MSHITEETFKNRFIAIILRGQVFPKKTLDRHILFISATAEVGVWTALFRKRAE